MAPYFVRHLLDILDWYYPYDKRTWDTKFKDSGSSNFSEYRCFCHTDLYRIYINGKRFNGNHHGKFLVYCRYINGHIIIAWCFFQKRTTIPSKSWMGSYQRIPKLRSSLDSFRGPFRNGPVGDFLEPWQMFHSWWFQPIWKNMLVKLDHFRRIPGVENQKKMETYCFQPPRP